MSLTSGFGIGFLLLLPLLIGQWVGVIGLAKCGRNPAWWCMLVGTILTSLSSVFGTAAQMYLLQEMRTSSNPESLGIVVAFIGGVSGLGSLLFVVGFAIHGLTSRKIRERIEQLESVLAAQGEQLSREGGERLS